jgi:NADPH-ferrihemoprotein reductase
MQLAPRLQPRVYTVASSALAQPGRLAIVASVLDAPKPGPDAARRMRGVATTQLERIARAGAGAGEGKGEREGAAPVFVRALVRPSTFRLPPDARTPVILVGPGTGVAPMRAFLHERRALRARGAAVGEAVLFFGCRRRGEDFILRGELESFLADGTLSALHTAFSREGAEGAPRVYVQQLVRAEAPALLALVARGAHVYVCGGTEMGKDVLAAFEAVGMPARELQRANPPRYVQELWSSH